MSVCPAIFPNEQEVQGAGVEPYAFSAEGNLPVSTEQCVVLHLFPYSGWWEFRHRVLVSCL